LLSNTIGYNNTAVGSAALYYNTTGSYNTALGLWSLRLNTTGSENTSLGSFSLTSNTTGSKNTAVGMSSLSSNINGTENTAVGHNSLFYNTSGDNNTAVGKGSLISNTTGSYNTAIGNNSLSSNTVGANNIAFGHQSSYSNNTGFNNTALGFNSLFNNTTGSYNTTVGDFAGSIINGGSNLTCIGNDAEPTTPSAINQITLGDNQVLSLRCNVQTITSLSDARDKKNVKDLSLGLDFLMKIKPRQFNWDKREWYENTISDGSKIKETPTAGFIAQELDEVQTTENAEWLNLVLKDNPEKLEATYGNLLPVMVKAIQELKEENNMLKERLSKFEQMVSDLTFNKNTSISETK
ncbi:MAG: tail fiber domain-containing protein, partial [Ignavibacteria bacterium]